MAINSSTSSSRRIPSRSAFAALLVSFAVLNLGPLPAAPYFDSNFMLLADINDRKWIGGADMLFLGDSRTHQGIIPAIISDGLAADGIAATAMNLARPGQQLPFMYFFSRRVTEEALVKPKAVVLNVSFYLLGGQQWMEDIYFTYYRPSIGEAGLACLTRLISCERAAEWFISTRLPALMFRSRVSTLLRKLFNTPESVVKELSGIQAQRETMRFEVASGYMTRGNGHIEPGEVPMPHGYVTGIENGYSVYLSYFDRMMENLTTQGIEVFVYQFPWPEQREFETGFAEILAYYDTLLQSRAREGVHFLPTYRFWPTEFFVDPLHLNHIGAERLSRELAMELADNPAFRRAMAGK